MCFVCMLCCNRVPTAPPHLPQPDEDAERDTDEPHAGVVQHLNDNENERQNNDNVENSENNNEN